MEEETKDNEEIKFRNVVTKLKIPDNYNVMPASAEPIIEFIIEVY